ncbi:MAG: peptide chain release factor 2 [Dehalococcoidia bacterium]
MNTILLDSKTLLDRIEQIVRRLDLAKLSNDIREFEDKINKENFWDDSNKAQKLMRQLSFMRSEFSKWSDIKEQIHTNYSLILIANEENDEEYINLLDKEQKILENNLNNLEIELQLRDEYDKSSALLYVKQGSGGVDAQDWAEILLRMYRRWAETKNYKLDILDITSGDEAGIKSATLKIEGDFAYGYLKSEKGTHRLVRLSPFDTDHRRHTSFALVEVLPEVDNDEEIKINSDDIRIDVFRASGNGGQSVQKNSTAVRITHLPSKTVVSVQNERSQFQNKEVALKILHSRLLNIKLEEQEKERQKIKGEHIAAEFGSQIRSYILHPYKMVKDHRTNFETKDAESVLDGKIDDFLKSYLNSKIK